MSEPQELVCLCIWTSEDALNPEHGPTEPNPKCPIHKEEE